MKDDHRFSRGWFDFVATILILLALMLVAIFLFGTVSVAPLA